MGQVIGRVTIRYDGNVVESLPGAKLSIGGTVRTARTTGKSVHHCEQLAAAEVEFETVLRRGQSLTEFRAISNATLEYEADTGQVWVLREAFCTDAVECTDGPDGRVSLKFAGSPADEILPQAIPQEG